MCLFANRLSFSELFDDISLMLNVRRLYVVVDILISASKVCNCVIELRGWTAVSPKYSVPAINIVSPVFSLADCTLGKQLSTQENWI